MKTETHLTSKGQLVIPKALRDRMRWKPGTCLAIETTDDGGIVLRPQGREESVSAILDQLSGCLKACDRDAIAELEADHQSEIEADEHWLRRRR